MGRDKLKRNLQFKPLYKEFAPLSCDVTNTIVLLHEEIEALYLMDNLGLYQADAAKKMGVSRPTFARIIKSAREKVSMALITGACLRIEDEKEQINIIVASSKEDQILLSTPKAEFFVLLSIKNKKIITQKIILNPLDDGAKPAEVLPDFFVQYQVNFFIASSVGAGVKNALLAKGIFVKEQEVFSLNFL